MKLRTYLVISLLIAAFGTLLLAGCGAKAPTEKVAQLEEQFKGIEAKGAAVFAADQFNAVSQKMSELKSDMDAKKFKEATAICDSLGNELTALQTAVDTNAKDMTTAAVAAAIDTLAKFKAMVTPETIKTLGADEGKKVQETLTALESSAAGLQADVDNGAFQNAFTNANAIKDQVGAAHADVMAKIEAAKAAKGAKAAKPAKKAKK